MGIFFYISKNHIPPEQEKWKLYQNADYPVTFRYPADWEFVDSQSSTGLIGENTFGLIPSSLKNGYCNIDQETTSLIKNYETNPFAGYKEYATKLSKEENCSIWFKFEKNSERLSIQEYLKNVYIPLAQQPGMADSVENAIADLKTTKVGDTEQVRIDYAFLKARFGIGTGEEPLQTILYDEDFTHQFIVNAGGQILFVTNTIQDDKTGTGLFAKIINSIQVR